MPPKILFDVEVQSVRWTESDLRVARKAIRQTMQSLKTLNFSVSLTLTTDKKIQKINSEWRGKNQPTNVLSFPSGELENTKTWPAKIPLPLGDIIVAHETCVREAKNFGIPLHHYIIFLAVHGALHLLGYSHETEVDHQKMIKAELRILKQLKLANPYPLMHNKHTNA